MKPMSVLAVAAFCLLQGSASFAQFIPPPPELENRIPQPLPPPPQPPFINGPWGQAPSPGVIKQRRIGSAGARATRCLHEGAGYGLRGGELSAYARACANAD
jgi:hypothetical protein